jgi:mono/diheme cytochrome c family protein
MKLSLSAKSVPFKIATLLLAALLAACADPPPPSATGEEVYQLVCANCHGGDLSSGVAPDIGAGSNSADQDDNFLELTITRGLGRMPSFEATLSEDQIARVIEYLRLKQQEGSG